MDYFFKENFKIYKRETSIQVELEDDKLAKQEYLGVIIMDLTLIPKYTLEEKDVI